MPISFLLLASCNPPPVEVPADMSGIAGQPVRGLSWQDGDSGMISGVAFRLAGIDAPELGEIGQGTSEARCEREQELGYKARAFANGMTRDSEIVITADFGRDAQGVRVLELSIDGADLGTLGVSTGYYKTWPHNGASPIASKPNWCLVQQ